MIYYLRLEYSGSFQYRDNTELDMRLLVSTDLDSATQEVNAMLLTLYSYGYPPPDFIKATILEVSNTIDIPLEMFKVNRTREMQHIFEANDQREFVRLKAKYEAGAK